MAKAPTTSSIGFYIRDMVGSGYIDDVDADSPEDFDHVDYVDDSDASNLRLVMASGAVFRVSIVRES
jgi:hypothetical protein